MLDELSSVGFRLGEVLIEPVLYMANPGKRIFWLYLLSAAVIAVAVVFWRGLGFKAAIVKALSPRLWLSPSSLVDIKWIGINQLVAVFLVVPILGGQISFALWINRLLSSTFGAGNFFNWGVFWTSVVFTSVVFLFEDFSRFILHYIYHKVPLLWRFHAIHHSATVLTPLTLYRIHSIEMAMNSCRSLLVIGGLSGVFIYLFDGAIKPIDILGASIFTFLFNLAGSNLRHSSVWLGYGWLEKVLISPAQHQIHHSVAVKHMDKNFGSVLSIWDGWIGSGLQSKGESVVGFGLSGQEREVKQGVGGQVLGL